MTELFRNQLFHELRQAGYHQAAMAEDKKTIVPVPEYPDLRIGPSGIRFGMDACEVEKDLAHDVMADIQQRAIDACRAWEHSTEMPGEHMGAENFRFISEFNDVMLAARNDGVRGLHFVTWEYTHDRTSVTHGHYTTSFTAAKEDFAVRSGLVLKEQLLDPAHLPLLYKALKTVENDYWLQREQDEQVDKLCKQFSRFDHEVANKAEDIVLLPADPGEQEETMEQEMQGL